MAQQASWETRLAAYKSAIRSLHITEDKFSYLYFDNFQDTQSRSDAILFLDCITEFANTLQQAGFSHLQASNCLVYAVELHQYRDAGTPLIKIIHKVNAVKDAVTKLASKSIDRPQLSEVTQNLFKLSQELIEPITELLITLSQKGIKSSTLASVCETFYRHTRTTDQVNAITELVPKFHEAGIENRFLTGLTKLFLFRVRTKNFSSACATLAQSLSEQEVSSESICSIIRNITEYTWDSIENKVTANLHAISRNADKLANIGLEEKDFAQVIKSLAIHSTPAKIAKVAEYAQKLDGHSSAAKAALIKVYAQEGLPQGLQDSEPKAAAIKPRGSHAKVRGTGKA